MPHRETCEYVVPVQNLRDYFRASMDAAIDKQGVDVDPHATHYVVNLLTLFARSEDLYEDHGPAYGLKPLALIDRKSTRLNSSHVKISYAVFCLKTKNTKTERSCSI